MLAMDLPVSLAMYWSGPASVLAWLWMALYWCCASCALQLTLDSLSIWHWLWLPLHWRCSGLPLAWSWALADPELVLDLLWMGSSLALLGLWVMAGL
jgi:hypothetical protein